VAAANDDEGWAVLIIGTTSASGGRASRTQHEGFACRGDAEHFGQCHWAGPEGRGVADVQVRKLPQGQWLPVMPASVCGGTRLR